MSLLKQAFHPATSALFSPNGLLSAFILFAPALVARNVPAAAPPPQQTADTYIVQAPTCGIATNGLPRPCRPAPSSCVMKIKIVNSPNPYFSKYEVH